MDINPIPYSAFIKEDDSINRLIALLEEVQNKYVDLLGIVSKDASSLKGSMSTINVASKEGRKAIEDVADGSAKLKRIQNELKIALSSTGVEIAKYKARLTDANKTNLENAKASQAAESSIKAMKAELALLVKQYESLTFEQRLVGGEYDKLIARIQSLRTEITNANATIAASKTAKQQEVKVTSDLDKAIGKLAKAYSDETMELIRIKRETDEVLKIKKLEVRAADGTAMSYDRLAAQYELNMINLNKYSQEVINSSRFLKRQQEESLELRMEMIRLKEATGNHTLSVGNYRKAWNGLHLATQQVVREMPSLAMSWNTFFIAISNNVPILVDEIGRVVEANKRAAAAGERTVSVWRQIGLSVFGWQTALVVLLTVLSMYGKQIIEFVQGLMKADEGLKTVEQRTKDVTKQMFEGTNAAATQIQTFSRLKDQWNALGDSIKDKKAFLETAKTDFSNLGIAVTDVTEAEKLFVADSENVIKGLILRAEAAAYATLAAEEMNKALKAEREADTGNAPTWQKELAKRGVAFFHTMNAILTRDISSMKALFNYKETLRAIDLNEDEKYRWKKGIEAKKFRDQSEADTKKEVELLKQAAVLLSEYDPEKKTKTPKGPTDLSIENENLKIRKRYLESVTDLERDELEKRRKQLQDAYVVEQAELLNKQKNEKRLTEESKQLINQIILNMDEKLQYDLLMLDIDFEQRKLNAEKEGLDLRLSLMEQGTMEYYETRNRLLRNQMQYEILENRKLIKEQQQDEQAIRAKYNYDILRNEIAMDDMFFAQIQSYQESEFNLIKRSEYEKTKFRLQQERDRQQRVLEMAKSGLLQMSNLEIETVKNIIAAIDRMLKENEQGRDIYDLLGLRLDDEDKGAIRQTVGFVKNSIAEMLAAEVELAEIKLEKAKEQVDKSYEFLKLEMEARNQGYAHRIETAEKEYQEARKREAEALRQREKAVIAQQRLDSIEQTASLVTASANIWKTFSKYGPIGVAGAIAAIALMFGTFIGAKVKARDVAKADTEEYEQGHVELLDGGSHRSGNDVPLGRTKSGKERRAEGGEVLAVVNKRSVSKYGASKIFDVVNSINKGVFEDKYVNIFNPVSQFVSGNETFDADLGDLNSNVKAIRNNSDYKYFNDSNGLLVEKYKNRTRVFKR